ncbi:hypothetical protein FACS1894103_6870 [Campylobacterota bacterium]|nr:hypothetical protein FACS1894103_6870 [Campylobacterota bacterium]
MAVRYGDVKRWRVALVHFGVPKKESALAEHQGAVVRYGVALGNEFAKQHYAIIIDNNERSHTAIVVPITSRRFYGDEPLYNGDIELNPNQYGLSAFLSAPSIAKTDCIRQVSHERIVKIVHHYITPAIREKIRRAMLHAMRDNDNI